jgi:uroporphyrinogen-III synthase
LNSPAPTIVVTRPGADAEALVDALEARSHPVIRSPAFALQPLPAPARQQVLTGLSAFDVAIVTSPFAATLTVSDAPPGDSPVYLAPGRGTAEILSASGLSVHHPEAGGTSEDLLAMPILEQVQGRAVAIVGAPGGRRLLDRELAARGATVSRIDVYRREPLPLAAELLAALEERRRLVVLASSRNAFAHLTDSLPPRLRSAWFASTFLVSSQRLLRICREAGVQNVRRAEGASDEAMLAALDAL